MRVYAGIDEAGYGPMFGPFVVARSVFTLDDADSAEAGPEQPPADLWRRLDRAVCRAVRDRRKRIAVNDSKKLYSPSGGLANLERGVLAFAHLAGREAGSLEQLLANVGDGASSRVPDLLWYSDTSDGPPLPAAWTDDQLAIARGMLRRSAASADVAVSDLTASVVYEDRFNQIIANTRSKARCAWTFVSQHLWAIWREHGAHHPWVTVDRQGGRKVYHELLQMIFEGAELRLVDESDNVSRYVIRDGERAMTISFEQGADANHLPAALASMTAKYVRELLMMRFNRFWKRYRPELKPTAGYVSDGRRFLAEIEPVIDRLGVERSRLIRSR